MTRNYEKELKELRAAAQEAEKKKVQLETRKEEALNRKAELEEKCDSLGVNPSEIGSHIEKTEAEIESLLKKAKAYLPEMSDEDDEAF